MPLGKVTDHLEQRKHGRQSNNAKVHLVTEKEQAREEERRKELPRLDWKDYVAITIAALQTTLLPLVLLFFVILAISIALGVFLFH